MPNRDTIRRALGTYDRISATSTPIGPHKRLILLTYSPTHLWLSMEPSYATVRLLEENRWPVLDREHYHSVLRWKNEEVMLFFFRAPLLPRALRQGARSHFGLETSQRAVKQCFDSLFMIVWKIRKSRLKRRRTISVNSVAWASRVRFLKLCSYASCIRR